MRCLLQFVSKVFPDTVAVLGLLTAVVLVWVSRLDGPIDLRSDAAVYYVLGTSMADGNGYRLLNEPGAIEATQYPPGLPALVAFHQWLAGSSDYVTVGQKLRRTFAVLFAAYILVAYMAGRQRLAAGWAFLATLAVLAHPFTLWLSDACYADIPFAFVATLFLLSSGGRPRALRSGLAAVCVVTAYLLRTIGITLMIAWIAEAAWRRNWREVALRGGVVAIPLIAWHLHIALVERSAEYERPAYPYQRAAYMFYNVSYSRNAALKAPFRPEIGVATTRDIAIRVIRNALKIPGNLGEVVSTTTDYWGVLNGRLGALPLVPTLPAVSFNIAVLALGAIVMTGLGILVSRGDRIIPLCVLTYTAALVATPWPWPFWRYWAAAAPFVTISFFVTLQTMSSNLPRRPVMRLLGSSALIGLVGVLVLSQVAVARWVFADEHQRADYRGPSGLRLDYPLFYYDSTYRALDEALDWVRDQAAPDAIIAASMPQYVFLRTGRRAVMAPFESDPAEAQRLLDAVPVSYLVLDGTGLDLARRYVEPVAQGSPTLWEVAYADPRNDLIVYRRRK